VDAVTGISKPCPVPAARPAVLPSAEAAELGPTPALLARILPSPQRKSVNGGLVEGLTLLLCIVLTAVACEGASSATDRFRQYFQLGEGRELAPGSAREALLAKIPRGSSEQEVYEFLKKAGIGSDGLSSFYPADKYGVIVCRIEFDRKSAGVVKESYGVFFLLNEQRQGRESREVVDWALKKEGKSPRHRA